VAGTELGSAYISVGLGTNTLGPEIKKVFGGIEGDAGAAGATAGKSFQGKFSGFMKSAALPAAGVVGGIALMAKGFGDLAATAEQNVGAVETVFGKASSGVAGFAANSANAVGLSSSSYNELSAVTGTALKSAGVSVDELASKNDALITRGADMASVFGGTTAEAVQSMGAAFRGEFDPLERYGVTLTASQVSAELAARGQDKLGGAALEAAKKQATMDLIMKKSAGSAGNFAKESDTAAGAQQRASAAWDDASAKLGEALLPIMTTVATKVSEMSKWISENSGLVTGLAIGIGILAGAIAVWSVVQGILNLVMLASPITWIILGIVALIAAIVLLVMNWDAVVNFLQVVWGGFINWCKQILDGFVVWWNGLWAGVGQFISDVWNNIVAWVTGAISNVWNTIMGVVNLIKAYWSFAWSWVLAKIQEVWNGITSWISNAINTVSRTVTGVLNTIKAYWSLAWAWVLAKVNEVWGGIKSGVSNGINSVVSFVSGIKSKVLGALSAAGSWLVSVGQNIIQGLIDGAKGMIGNAVQAVKDVGGSMLDGIKGFLGIHSPSRVFKTQVGMMIGAGLIAGISASESGVNAAVNNLVAVPSVPSFTAGSYTPASSFGGGAPSGGFANYGTIHVRDEEEMTRIFLTRQRDAQAAHGF
jgi:phage-related protein